MKIFENIPDSVLSKYIDSADWWMVGLTVAIVLASILSGLFTYLQLRATRKSQYASLTLELLDRYSSPEMLESLAALRQFRLDNFELIKVLTCLHVCTYQNIGISSETIDMVKQYNNELEKKVGEGIGVHRVLPPM